MYDSTPLLRGESEGFIDNRRDFYVSVFHYNVLKIKEVIKEQTSERYP
jgi:hypothetical protein